MSVDPARHLFTVEEYERMGEAGVFDPDLRLELLGGEIFEMAPIGSHHAGIVNRLTEFFILALAGAGVVTVQNPVRLSDLSEPQPDLTVLRRDPDFYVAAHPRPADVLLMIEVADSTIRWDRRVKRPFYAKAGIEEFWLIDVNARVVEVATEPGPDDYRQVRTYDRGAITMTALPDLPITVADLLGLP